MSFRKWPMLVARIMARTVLSAPLFDGCCAALMLILLLRRWKSVFWCISCRYYLTAGNETSKEIAGL